MGVKPKGEYPQNWKDLAKIVKDEAGWACVRCKHPHRPEMGRCLTVHHWDGDKANGARWNLMPLCQACHLSVQARVDPRNPLMFEPAAWAIPYVVGAFAAGLCIPAPGFDLPLWRRRYEQEVGPWPAWAEEYANARY